MARKVTNTGQLWGRVLEEGLWVVAGRTVLSTDCKDYTADYSRLLLALSPWVSPQIL